MGKVGARENGVEWKIPEVCCACIDIDLSNNRFVFLGAYFPLANYGHRIHGIAARRTKNPV
jgi:hypothetical protein